MKFTRNGNIIVILTGLILATIQFLSGRSVWMDEAKLAMNIIDRSYLELLTPLDDVQVAPILFLWTQRFFMDIFGAGDMTFRLLPLLAFFLSCYVIYKLVKALRLNTRTQFVVISLFALCQPLIYYASEIKQYGVDVAVALSLVYLVVKSYKNKRNQILILSICGLIAIGFSNISVILLFVTGLYLWYTIFKKSQQFINWSLIPITIWATGFIGYYLAFIHNHPTPAIMNPYWESFAYMPWNIFSAEFWAFWGRSYIAIFGKILGVNPKIPLVYHLFAVAYCLGIVAFWKSRRRDILFLCVMPLLVHIILSGLHLYPFVHRVGQYLHPLFAIVCARGFVFGADFFISKTGLSKLKYALLFPAVVMLFITLYTFPKDREEFKESYEFMLSRKRTEDKIFTNSGADNTWYYYEKIGYIPEEVTRQISEFHRYNFKGHHKQLDALSGRVWFLVSHDYYNAEEHEMLESEYILNYLKARGAIVLEQKEFIGSSIYLLDFVE